MHHFLSFPEKGIKQNEDIRLFRTKCHTLLFTRTFMFSARSCDQVPSTSFDKSAAAWNQQVAFHQRRKKAFQWGATVHRTHKDIRLDIKTLEAAAVWKLYCNNEQHFVFANWLCACLLAQSQVCQAVAVCCNTVCAARSTPGFPESMELTFSAGCSLRQMGPLDRLSMSSTCCLQLTATQSKRQESFLFDAVWISALIP